MSTNIPVCIGRRLSTCKDDKRKVQTEVCNESVLIYSGCVDTLTNVEGNTNDAMRVQSPSADYKMPQVTKVKSDYDIYGAFSDKFIPKPKPSERSITLSCKSNSSTDSIYKLNIAQSRKTKCVDNIGGEKKKRIAINLTWNKNKTDTKGNNVDHSSVNQNYQTSVVTIKEVKNQQESNTNIDIVLDENDNEKNNEEIRKKIVPKRVKKDPTKSGDDTADKKLKLKVRRASKSINESNVNLKKSTKTLAKKLVASDKNGYQVNKPNKSDQNHNQSCREKSIEKENIGKIKRKRKRSLSSFTSSCSNYSLFSRSVSRSYSLSSSGPCSPSRHRNRGSYRRYSLSFSRSHSRSFSRSHSRQSRVFSRSRSRENRSYSRRRSRESCSYKRSLSRHSRSYSRSWSRESSYSRSCSRGNRSYLRGYRRHRSSSSNSRYSKRNYKRSCTRSRSYALQKRSYFRERRENSSHRRSFARSYGSTFSDSSESNHYSRKHSRSINSRGQISKLDSFSSSDSDSFSSYSSDFEKVSRDRIPYLAHIDRYLEEQFEYNRTRRSGLYPPYSYTYCQYGKYPPPAYNDYGRKNSAQSVRSRSLSFDRSCIGSSFSSYSSSCDPSPVRSRKSRSVSPKPLKYGSRSVRSRSPSKTNRRSHSNSPGSHQQLRKLCGKKSAKSISTINQTSSKANCVRSRKSRSDSYSPISSSKTKKKSELSRHTRKLTENVSCQAEKPNVISDDKRRKSKSCDAETTSILSNDKKTADVKMKRRLDKIEKVTSSRGNKKESQLSKTLEKAIVVISDDEDSTLAKRFSVKEVPKKKHPDTNNTTEQHVIKHKCSSKTRDEKDVLDSKGSSSVSKYHRKVVLSSVPLVRKVKCSNTTTPKTPELVVHGHPNSVKSTETRSNGDKIGNNTDGIVLVRRKNVKSAESPPSDSNKTGNNTDGIVPFGRKNVKSAETKPSNDKGRNTIEGINPQTKVRMTNKLPRMENMKPKKAKVKPVKKFSLVKNNEIKYSQEQIKLLLEIGECFQNILKEIVIRIADN